MESKRPRTLAKLWKITISISTSFTLRCWSGPYGLSTISLRSWKCTQSITEKIGVWTKSTTGPCKASRKMPPTISIFPRKNWRSGGKRTTVLGQASQKTISAIPYTIENITVSSILKPCQKSSPWKTALIALFPSGKTRSSGTYKRISKFWLFPTKTL